MYAPSMSVEYCRHHVLRVNSITLRADASNHVPCHSHLYSSVPEICPEARAQQAALILSLVLYACSPMMAIPSRHGVRGPSPCHFLIDRTCIRSKRLNGTRVRSHSPSPRCLPHKSQAGRCVGVNMLLFHQTGLVRFESKGVCAADKL
jgi:hypothetical protein